jgi:hypothetical protein
MGIASSIPPSQAMAPRYALPALLVLVLQVALYGWMASRGFEFTDEAYYFHNFLHWREFTGTVTFFGAYFEWPFRAMGSSITGMRLLSLLVVLASAGVLMNEVLRFSFRGADGAGSLRASALRPTFWYILAPMASAMLYFGYLSTLRAPSYNLLALCTMAVMTACMLRAIETQRAGASPRVAPFLYGLALGTCFLSKASTAALAVLAHLVFFVAVNRDWKLNWLLKMVALVCAGFALNLLVLTAAYPGWVESMREGMELSRLRDTKYGFGKMFFTMRWEIQLALTAIGPWLLGAAALLVVLRKALASRVVVSLLAIVLMAAIAVAIVADHRTRFWLIIIAAIVLALWLIEYLAARGHARQGEERRELALMGLLLALPIVFSFGTNMPLLEHSIIASMFAFCAVYLRLYRLAHMGLLAGPPLAVCLVLLCAPALLAQYLALTDVRYTYRQAAPLGEQDRPVAVGAGHSVVRVDASTERSLRSMREMVAQAGMPAGQDVLDLTGDGPGAIYAIGAYPLGSPWMLGGYPGSAVAVERVLEKTDPSRLRQAWLLTSTDNRRRMLDWQGMVARRIGPVSHQLVGSIEIVNPHFGGRNEPRTVNLQLWRPAAQQAHAATLQDSGAPGRQR